MPGGEFWIATRRDIEPFEERIDGIVPKVEPILLDKHNRAYWEKIAFNGGALNICINGAGCVDPEGEFQYIDHQNLLFYLGQSTASDMLVVRAVLRQEEPQMQTRTPVNFMNMILADEAGNCPG